MKILKIIGFALLGLIALFLIVALFLPSTMHIERSIVIEKPVNEVYSKVADLTTFGKWNPWTEYEPTAKSSATGTPGQVGQVWSWEGKEVGSGNMTVTEVQENKLVKTKLLFTKPMEDESQSYWALEPQGNSTKVSWVFDDAADYPMGRWMGLMMGGMLGKDFDKGLSNLKKLSEGK